MATLRQYFESLLLPDDLAETKTLHTQTHMHTLTHTLSHIHTHKLTDTHIHIHTDTHSLTYAQTHTLTYTQTHIHSLTYTHRHIHSHAHRHTHTHTLLQGQWKDCLDLPGLPLCLLGSCWLQSLEEYVSLPHPHQPHPVITFLQSASALVLRAQWVPSMGTWTCRQPTASENTQWTRGEGGVVSFPSIMPLRREGHLKSFRKEESLLSWL